MLRTIPIINPEQATKIELIPLTNAYLMPDEMSMMLNAINTLNKDQIGHALIIVPGGLEVWRADNENQSVVIKKCNRLGQIEWYRYRDSL